MNRGKLILVTGGARSGKSTFAERYASDSGKQVIYLATAEVKDPEMQLRVEEHRRHRPPGISGSWRNRCIRNAYWQTEQRVLFFLLDCLTLLLNNHLLQRLEGEINTSPQKQAEISTVILNYMDGLAGQMQNCPADVLVVTNEVGLGGVVPENFLGRLFRDLAGKTNQKVAARADEVWFAVCGIAKRFK